MTSRDLWGLVLAGGRSRRMGQDKGSLVYTGKSQRETVVELLQPFCRRVCVSCRSDQAVEPGLEVITDIIRDAGPLAGMLSAFAANPEVAWLVVACDLPLLNAATLTTLCAQRDRRAPATAFRHPQDGEPEPLLAIWEPSSLPLVRQAFADGARSPLKLLQQMGCHLVDAPDPQALQNVNTPAEQGQILNTLQVPQSHPGIVS